MPKLLGLRDLTRSLARRHVVMMLQKLAGALIVGLSISVPLNLAWADTGFDRAFHAYHLAEIGCKLWYKGASRSEKEDTLGRKACQIVEHPFASMLKHRPA